MEWSGVEENKGNYANTVSGVGGKGDTSWDTSYTVLRVGVVVHQLPLSSTPSLSVCLSVCTNQREHNKVARQPESQNLGDAGVNRQYGTFSHAGMKRASRFHPTMFKRNL